MRQTAGKANVGSLLTHHHHLVTPQGKWYCVGQRMYLVGQENQTE